jgi:carbamoyltransferase
MVLGLSHLEHDSAATLLNGGDSIAVIEEDKLSRAATAGGVPRMAMDYCLQQAGAELRHLTSVAVEAKPAARGCAEGASDWVCFSPALAPLGG